MSETKKRTNTDRYVERLMKAEREIAGTYAAVVRNHAFIETAIQPCLDIISRAKVPQSYKDRLYAYRDGVRTIVCMTHARWQLYVMNEAAEPVASSDVISAMRSAGDENVWSRVIGRFEWVGTHIPFYDDPRGMSHDTVVR